MLGLVPHTLHKESCDASTSPPLPPYFSVLSLPVAAEGDVRLQFPGFHLPSRFCPDPCASGSQSPHHGAVAITCQGLSRLEFSMEAREELLVIVDTRLTPEEAPRFPSTGACHVEHYVTLQRLLCSDGQPGRQSLVGMEEAFLPF